MPRKPWGILKIDSTDVGSGIVDWERVLPTAYRAGARNFHVEQEPSFRIDHFEAAARGHAYLSRI